MANAQVDTGHGAAITFGTSSYAFNWLGIKPPKETRASIPTEHLGSTAMTLMPGDLPKYETSAIRFQYDTEAAKPVTSTTAETITITWPLPAGGSTQATLAGSGLIVGVDLDELVTGTIQTGTLEIDWNGTPTPTAGT
jgi:hypothetical protein